MKCLGIPGTLQWIYVNQNVWRSRYQFFFGRLERVVVTHSCVFLVSNVILDIAYHAHIENNEYF